MRRILMVFTFWLCTILPAVAQNRTSDNSSQQREIASLREQLKDLQNKVTTLENTVSFYQLLISGKQDRQDSVRLDLSDHAYQRLDMSNGFLLVSVVEATPYLNGYKVKLKLGNPMYVDYSGFTAKIRWAKSYDFAHYTDASYKEWNSSVQEKEIPSTDVLHGGSWNSVELILTPATAEQLEFVNLSITASTLALFVR